MALEEILIKTITKAAEIAFSNYYAGTHIGVFLLHYYFSDKNSKLNNISTIATVALTADSMVWPWLGGKSLHSTLGFNPDSLYEPFIVLFERISAGILNLELGTRTMDKYLKSRK